ncbi:uncharacterized protein LOC125237332 [Leguminivora glycinivorella]|uniref:uncharacterized protein LOC125237332 n=1 Tax=Leguminivora glycinivorella TaxID=1035111 RepID=UPI00200D604D|nr:uncharacterized protein LOC125237332 [Leguminivora glycinivorella]
MCGTTCPYPAECSRHKGLVQHLTSDWHWNDGFFSTSVNVQLPAQGERYYNNLPEEIRNATWFQLDGAPAHSTVAIREKLSELFGDRWIGRFGPKRWPPRSPDLTCLDFFLWGAIKNDVYSAEVDNVEMLKDRIIQAFNTIRQRDLNVVHRNTLLRYEACIQAHGQHIENILN